MARLIDADAYAAELWRMRQNYQMLDDTHTADKIMHGIFRAEQVLKEQPTVDAVPVVHAYWTTKRTWQHDGEIYCSECENDAPTEGDYRQVKTKYCPNCGAIMDGKEKKMFEAKQTHVGQYKRYGDFFREWEITTDRSKEETIEWCFNNLYQRRVPREAEWRRNIVYGGDKWGDAGYFFGGYYSISSLENGFKFVICEPYAD